MLCVTYCMPFSTERKLLALAERGFFCTADGKKAGILLLWTSWYLVAALSLKVYETGDT